MKKPTKEEIRAALTYMEALWRHYYSETSCEQRETALRVLEWMRRVVEVEEKT